MTRKELLEAILFCDEYEIQDTKVLLVYVLERIDDLEEELACLNGKLETLLLKL